MDETLVWQIALTLVRAAIVLLAHRTRQVPPIVRLGRQATRWVRH
jgi:hypothetical protein